jgi:uncharacterized membrane protein
VGELSIFVTVMNEFYKNNGDYWKWGIFYNNPKDPSVWVEKRTGLGWTVNFAHRISYIIMAMLVILPLVAIWLCSILF